VSVEERIVRSLLAEQHPDLARLPLTHVADGWDNELWRLGDSLAVRLPRRDLAAPLARKEQRWLPELAPRLPLPIPVPLRAGAASGEYPWPWSIVPWLGGEPGDREPMTRPDDAARRLGGFLRGLHEPAPPDAPHNPFRGVPLADRGDAFDERLSALADEVDVGAARAVWNDGVAAGWEGPPVWVHGDLHPANVLVEDGTISAVIDWGDLTAGDPAIDLAAAWLLLPAGCVRPVLDAYGDTCSALERRASAWAIYFALVLLGIGLDPRPISGRPTYAPIGRRALRELGAATRP
jgi:aminoglycoside phosphotransferase (APT) family kinase protein